MRVLPLQPGDPIYILAPSGSVPDPQACLHQIKQLISSWGFVPLASPDLFGETQSIYNYANALSRRTADFKAAMHSAAKAIWCVRGGYGANQVLEQICSEQLEQPAHPKLLIGFSDITQLHQWVIEQWDWPALHAPVASQCVAGKVKPECVEQLRQLLTGECTTLNWRLQPLNTQARAPERIKASVVGGNLATILSTLKTPWEMNFRDRIVFFEEINEAPYQVHRMLTQLRLAGAFKGVKAVIFADFLMSGDETSQTQRAFAQCVTEFAQALDCPVLRGEHVGHGAMNYPVLLNTPAILQLGQKPQLVTSTEVADFEPSQPVSELFS